MVETDNISTMLLVIVCYFLLLCFLGTCCWLLLKRVNSSNSKNRAPHKKHNLLHSSPLSPVANKMRFSNTNISDYAFNNVTMNPHVTLQDKKITESSSAPPPVSAHAEQLAKSKCELAAARAELIAAKKSSAAQIRLLRCELNSTKVNSRDNKAMHDIMEAQNRHLMEKRDEAMKLLLNSDARKKALEVTVEQLEKKFTDLESEQNKNNDFLKCQLQAANEEKDELSKKKKACMEQVSEYLLKIDVMTADMEHVQVKLESRQVTIDALHQERRERNDDLSLSIERMTKELNGANSKLFNAESEILELKMELSSLSDVNATIELKRIQLENTVDSKEKWIAQTQMKMKNLINKLTKQPQCADAADKNMHIESVTAHPSDDLSLFECDFRTLQKIAYEYVKQNNELTADLSKVTEKLEFMSQQISEDRQNVLISDELETNCFQSELTVAIEKHSKQVNNFRQKLDQVQSISNKAEEKNKELITQLMISSDKLGNLERQGMSDKSDAAAKLQEKQDALNRKEAEIVLLRDSSHRLSEELESSRFALNQRSQKVSMLEAVAREKDAAIQASLTKIKEISNELSCVTEECSILKQQLADASPYIVNERAVTADKLKESSDALSCKEEEIEQDDNFEQKLYQVQNIANKAEGKNKEHNTQLMISSEILGNLKRQGKSDLSDGDAKLQEKQDAINRNAEMLLFLTDSSHRLNIELGSVRFALNERSQKVSMLEAAAREKDATIQQSRAKLIEISSELSCVTEECLILKQQLADASLDVANERAVTAVKLKESSDALSRIEDEVEKFDSLEQKLYQVQNVANKAEEKNKELIIQLMISSDALNRKEAEILLLTDSSHRLNDELESVRFALNERSQKASMLGAAAREKDATIQQSRTKLIEISNELSCVTEECSILKQQLAYASLDIANERAVTAVKLKEYSDALSHKEEEVKVLTKEFGLIQGELFHVMEQLNVEMKDLQDNLSSLRDTVNVKDKIIEELQTDNSVKSDELARLYEQLESSRDIVLCKEEDMDEDMCEEVDHSRDRDDIVAILLGTKTAFLFNELESVIVTDIGCLPAHLGSEHKKPAVSEEHNLESIEENLSMASNTDESIDLIQLDFFFGSGTASLLRTAPIRNKH